LSTLDLLRDPQALIFDLDGTLVDTVEARIESWMRTLDEAGIAADRDHVAGMIGADGKKLVRDVAERTDHELSPDEVEQLDKRSGEKYDELNVHPKPTSGARSLVVALEQSKLHWAIATSSLAAQTKASIAALELPQSPTVVDGSHVENAKPAPDLLLLAAKQLDTPADGCWYVGDSTWDMRAANAAGMVGVGVAYGAATDADLTQAGATVVTTLPELESELRRRGLLGD
jgi:HAD superfamily hydrolase (TIGR01509 family)